MPAEADVVLGGRRIRPGALSRVGSGGEADVFDLRPYVPGQALKLFRTPSPPGSDPIADRRLAEHQTKLPALASMANLPTAAIKPSDVALDARSGAIRGYAMPLVPSADRLLRYADPDARRGIDAIGPADVLVVFQRLHAVLEALHQAGVVVGDFNPLNVLVVRRANQPYVIDLDSAQFGAFVCRQFTSRYLDPLLAASHGGGLTLARPYGPDADWYAFAVMLFESLLLVHPYSGVHAPEAGALTVPTEQRPLRRISVFHPGVVYPRRGVPLAALPDDLLEIFRAIVVGDQRGVFPRSLLEQAQWSRCQGCGLSHARPACPGCARPAVVPAARRAPSTLLATIVAQIEGDLLHVVVQDGALRWVRLHDKQLWREDGRLVGSPAAGARVAIQAHATLIGDASCLSVVDPHLPLARLPLDPGPSHLRSAARSFAANARHRFWLAGGTLHRDAPYGLAEPIGQVPAGQTLIWVGDRFGIGLSWLGSVSVGFVWDADRRAIRDGLRLPLVGGEPIDADATFSGDRGWLWLASREADRLVHRCILLRADGSVEAASSGPRGGGTWLDHLHGACAVGAALFVPTDTGIVRVEAAAGGLHVAREFPDTASLVGGGDRLLPAPDGLYVASNHTLRLLRLVPAASSVTRRNA